MECVANIEIKTECSIVEDSRSLTINHPRNLYRAHLKNIPRSVFSEPFLISLVIYFDAPSLNESKDIAHDLTADCLNMIAFATGSRFQFHRIKQIAEVKPDESGMNSILFWGESIEYDDPQPFITRQTTDAIEKLSLFDAPKPIQKALRWYRLGVNATVPDDQFMNFWFALEIIAEFQKPNIKVQDKCPKCKGALYCESCQAYPEHKPYLKQVIKQLLIQVCHCDDATFDMLDSTRNSLMHGQTMGEIEGNFPDLERHIVDILGRLVWIALIDQFPKEYFDGKLSLGYPSTYVRRNISGIASIKMPIPLDANGDLDLSFKGIQVSLKASAPPQSEAPMLVTMNLDQYDALGKLCNSSANDPEVCRRIRNYCQIIDDKVHTLILSTDYKLIVDSIARGQTGELQSLFNEIFEANTPIRYIN